jgi:putative DNA primase/helicase
MSNTQYSACTDLGNADRFIQKHGDKVRYLQDLGRWPFWDGTRWKPVHYAKIFGMARKTVKAIYDEARDCDNKDTARALAAHAIRSESFGRIQSMISVVSRTEPVSTSSDLFDTDPRKINCRNGVVDLGTGELTAHKPNQLIIKQAQVSYDPKATCPRFERFLNEIFLDDQELMEYFLRTLGYALTGETVQQKVFIWYGLGANGKTTLSETLLTILGDYAGPTEIDMLLSSDRSQVRLLESVGKLKGMRLAIASETDSTRRFSESMVKRLSGEETLSGAVLTKGKFEFAPTHKLTLLVNHLPGVKDGSHSIWRRLVPIPFRRKFTAKEIDPYLKQTLLRERDGIFAKLVLAAGRYLKDGLGPVPKCITDLSDEYRERNDVLGRFVKECLEPNRSADAPAREVYRAYENWCGQHGITPVSEAFFSDGMLEREIPKRRKSAGMVYVGYGLRTANKASLGAKSEMDAKPMFKSPYGGISWLDVENMTPEQEEAHYEGVLEKLRW